MWKALRITLGVILLVIGIIALVTPMTPGAFLGLIGLELLGWGFLIPKRARDFWEESSVNRWLEKKLKRIGYPQHESKSPVPASPRSSTDNPPDTSPPSS